MSGRNRDMDWATRAVAGLMVVMLLSGCVRALRHAGERMRQGNSPAATVTAGDSGTVDAVRSELEYVVKQGAPGVTAIAMRDGKQILRVDVGKIDSATQYPIASSSKWMAAALVISVVDEGSLSLDEPISKFLPEFQGEAGRITLRELLAQTSGTGSLKGLVDVRQNPRITLAQSAAQIARRPLEDPPGAVFKYGGPGFQIAGALVEAATGHRWADLFEERIARPLGMAHTYWTHLPARGVSPAETRNPLLQGGVVTTADDYMRFLGMLADHGRFAGRQILSTKAVDAMETIQTLGKPLAYVPPGAMGNAQYALGNWCERWTAGGHCTLVSSPGAFGTFPWIDWQTGTYGIFFMRDRLPGAVANFARARRAIIAGEEKAS
ncbi:MAG TPA: serine hydrolase domain-containing protein [Micropepsaceae bacterium]|nr:serine hydrolase domain-containing protein [Micropepsaceae bacterium]